MDIDTLEAFLNYNSVPKIKKRTKTFLGIARQPHYENVLSNIYAFFFTISEVHKMNDLFITSLLQVLKNKSNGTDNPIAYFNDFDVATELTTVKGGRIDLLLSNSEQAIIIENKVYHRLNNDLLDYWESVKVANQKIGIVLSLNHIGVSDSNFINITHLELMKKVMENSGPYLIEAQDKYIVFLKDFYQNIINLSKSEMDTKDLNFYYINQEKINAVKDFMFSVRTHISNQVEIACEILDEKLNLQIPKGNGKNRLRYYQSPRNSNLMFTVVYEELLKPEKRLFLIVELTNELLKDKTRYKTIILSDEEKQVFSSDFYHKKGQWAHFAFKSYTLNTDEVKDLSSFIVKKLEEDHLLSIYRKLNDFITA